MARSSVGCSWCGRFNAVAGRGWPTCGGCGHRADLPRIDCECERCARAWAAYLAAPPEVVIASPDRAR